MAGRGCKKIISPDDMAKAESYALLNCKDRTICLLMGWADNFINQREEIRARMEVKRAEHRLCLRESQSKHIKNPIMAIFLGKNCLGQADKQEISGKDGAPLLAPVINVMPKEKP